MYVERVRSLKTPGVLHCPFSGFPVTSSLGNRVTGFRHRPVGVLVQPTDHSRAQRLSRARVTCVTEGKDYKLKVAQLEKTRSEVSLSNFHHQLGLLKTFHAQGKKPSLQSSDANERSNARWIYRVRKEYFTGTLSPEYEEKLAPLGLFDKALQVCRNFDEVMDELRLFVDTKDGCLPKANKRVPPSELKLYYWVHNQVQKHRDGNLSLECQDQLNAIGVDLENRLENLRVSFEDRFDLLVPFVADHERPPNRSDKGWRHWLKTAKKRAQAGELEEHQVKKLKELITNTFTFTSSHSPTPRLPKSLHSPPM